MFMEVLHWNFLHCWVLAGIFITKLEVKRKKKIIIIIIIIIIIDI